MLLLAGTSCRKLVTIEPPADQLTTETVFATEESALAAVRGLYSEIMRANGFIGNGAMSVFGGLSADELARTSSFPLEDAFQQNQLTPSNFYVQSAFWSKAYFHLYQANSLLENLARSTSLSDGLRRQLQGEVRFLRAFFYFYLVNLFGPVPLATTPDYRTNATLPRSDTTAVYGLILQDLGEAKALLLPAYPSAERLRVNRWAAAALLARVQLYLRNWTAAEAEATAVLSAGPYTLAPLATAFLPASPETILQWQPAQSQNFNTAEGFSFIPSGASSRPAYMLTPELVAAFETGDLRRSGWVRTVTVGGTPYHHPYKYKVRTGTAGAPKTEYNILLRLAELYLVRAEARAEQGDLAGARGDLNQVRSRAGLGPVVAVDREAVLAAITAERRVELFAEWGHRWLDLKRRGQADAVLVPLKGPFWQSTDMRYPVPQAEILSNPALTQNPGY